MATNRAIQRFVKGYCDFDLVPRCKHIKPTNQATSSITYHDLRDFEREYGAAMENLVKAQDELAAVADRMREKINAENRQ